MSVQQTDDMAPSLETLPAETLLSIAEMCTWDFALPPTSNAHPAAYARSHAALARTCRRLYQVLNRDLYMRNLNKDPPTSSCVLWAVNVGNIDTVKRAVAYGAVLDERFEPDQHTTYCPPWGKSISHLFSFPPRWFSLIHLAVGRGHIHIVEYLLERGVDVHAPSLNLCCKSQTYAGYFGAPLYPLHLCLAHWPGNSFPIEWEPLEYCSAEWAYDAKIKITSLLVTKGAYLEARNESAIHGIDDEGYRSSLNTLLARSDQLSLSAGLYFAAWRQDLVLATGLIQRGANAAAGNRDNTTTLHRAVGSCDGDLSLVNLLLRQPRVNPAARNDYGETPVHSACHNGNPDLIRLLLQQPGVSATQLDRKGASSLHYACQSIRRHEPTEAVKILIEKGVPLNQVCSDGDTPLSIALTCKKYQTASILVREGCDPSSWCCRYDDPKFKRWFSMEPESQTEFVQRLIDIGVGLEASSAMRKMGLKATLLYFAASSLNVDCMKALLRAGARADSVVVDFKADDAEGNRIVGNTYKTLLVAVLCQVWGNVNRPHLPRLGRRILSMAEETIRVLLENGAQLGPVVNSPTTTYMSAIEYGFGAEEVGDSSLLELLLDYSTAENIEQKFLNDFLIQENYLVRYRRKLRKLQDRVLT